MKVTKCSSANVFFRGDASRFDAQNGKFLDRNIVTRINELHTHDGGWSVDKKYYPMETVYDILKNPFEINVNGQTKSFKVENAYMSNLNCLDHKPDGTPVMPEFEGNQELINDSRKFDMIKPLVVCQPTKNGGNVENIRQLLKNNPGKIFGFKFHPELGTTPMETAKALKLYEPYMELAQEYKLPCVFHSGVVGSVSDPWKIYELANRTPDVPVVLYHMSLAPFGKVGDLSVEERARRGLLGRENDYIWNVRENWNNEGINVVKSALKHTDANLYAETSWTKPETVTHAVRELGAKRVLFGTDAPLGEFISSDFYKQNLASHINEIVKSFGDKSEEVLTDVFYKNAQDLFVEKNWTQKLAQKSKSILPDIERIVIKGLGSVATIAMAIMEHPPKL